MAIAFSNEDYKKISALIPGQLPEHIREDAPGFVAFLQAYYEYLEQEGKPLHEIMSLRDNFDIDRTVTDFLEYFRREFLLNIPTSALADKRILAKNIRDFYRTKGTKGSYRFLFRILFDKEIDFYYPGEDILRASDGRWTKETVIRVSAPFTVVPTEMAGRQVIGNTSGAKGQIQAVIGLELSGLKVYEMTIEKSVGTFVDGETVTDSLGETATIQNTIGAIQDINLGDGNRGAYNTTGDVVSISGTGATAANGTVSGATDRSALTFRIVNPGSGYRIACTSIILTGGSGSGARFSITSLSNTNTLSLNTDRITPFQNIPLNRGVYFVTGGGNTAAVSANMATANVSSTIGSKLVFATSTVGSIASITLEDVGYGYDRMEDGLPTVSVVDQQIADASVIDTYYGGTKGRNATIVANNAPGALLTIQMNNLGANFNKNEALILSNVTKGAPTSVSDTSLSWKGHTVTTIRDSVYVPTVTATVSGVARLPGRYTDTKGFLSWNNKLQDNYFYQEYSYVIKATELVDSYREVLKKLVHPAGTKFFGFYQISALLDQSQYMAISDAVISVSMNIEMESGISVDSLMDEEQVEPEISLYVPDVNAASYVAVWKQAPNYMKIDVANSTIAAYAASSITPYALLPIAFFDGTPRLVVSTTGTAWYANSTLRANSGSISVGGRGTNLMIVALSESTANGLYSVNTIFSNTTMSLRRGYDGDALSNGYFYYQTSGI